MRTDYEYRLKCRKIFEYLYLYVQGYTLMYYINFRIIDLSRIYYNLVATFSASFSICCKSIVRVYGKQVILEYHRYHT